MTDLRSGSFELTHVYANDLVYLVDISVSDDDGLGLGAGLIVSVENAAPQIVFDSPAQLVPTGSILAGSESETLSINAQIVDAGEQDTFNVSIDFGDGSDLVVLNSVGTSAIGDVISHPHLYVDDPGNLEDLYTVTVTISDTLDPTSTAIAQATVVVENQAPILESFDGGDAQDQFSTVPVGQSVTLNATFTEVGIADSLTFEVEWGDGNKTTDATITYNPDSQTGTIVATHAYSTDGVFPISVRLLDTDGGESDTQTSTAYVGTLTNTPATLSLSPVVTELPEDTDVSARVHVADVNITDDGLGFTATTITGDDASLFEIDNDRLYLLGNATLDPDTNPVLDVTVEIDDPTLSLPPATASLSLPVTYAFNFPPAIDAQTFAVDENVAGGTIIGTVVASDADQNDLLIYRIVSGNTENIFEIDLAGELTVAQSGQVDYETTSSHSLIVEVSDNGSPARSRQANVTVNVNPVNDNAPVFTSSTAASVRNATTLVQTLAATDADLPAQSIGFSITSNGADDDKFELIGDQLQFKTAPDFENPTDLGGTPGDNIYQVEVAANDGNGLITTQTVLVTITNSPGVDSVVIGDGSAQRSMVRSVTVTFDRLVTIAAGAFEVFNTTHNLPTVPTVTTTLDNAGRTVATLTFTDGLSDGNYRLTIKRDHVIANGQMMEADRTDDFFRLFGDNDGDRDVDLFDFAAFRNSYGELSADHAFDHDNNGQIDMFDFAEFRNQFGKRLPE